MKKNTHFVFSHLDDDGRLIATYVVDKENITDPEMTDLFTMLSESDHLIGLSPASECSGLAEVQWLIKNRPLRVSKV